MNPRTLLVSVLMFVSILLSACAPAARATSLPVIPPTDTTIPVTTTRELLTSDPNALGTVAGNYSYSVVGKNFNFILNADGSYNSLASFGKFTVTAEQITFVESGSDCASQPGTYRWSLDGNVLHLTSIKDDCQRRADLFGSQEFEQEQAAIPSDPTSLALIAGTYTYKDGAETFQLNLFSNESFISVRNPDGFVVGSGLISVTVDQITFAGYYRSCQSQPGVYKWSVRNNVLHLTLIKDECQHRVEIFSAQEFEKAPENNTSATLIWEIPASVNGIATDSQGNVYIVDGGATFSKYDTTGKLLGFWARGLSYTTGIAVDGQGNIYVANFQPPEILKFAPDGNPLLTWTIADGIGPDGLAVDPQGNVYVALHRLHDHYVEKYDAQGKLLATWAKPDTAGGQIKAGPFSGPGDVVVDANGDSYITDAGEQVHKYDKDGKFLYDIPHPGSITIDTQGNLYLSVSEDNAILKFDSHGKQIGKWFTLMPVIPSGYFYGIALDKDSNIFLYSDTILAKIKLPEQ